MAKKTQPTAAQPAFADLPFTEPAAEVAAPAQSDQAKLLADLQQQIGKLQADLDGQRQTNLALMSQPMVQVPATEAKQIDLSNLPDPTLEPEKYAAEVAQRTTRYIGDVEGQRAARANAERQQNTRVEALWEDFNDKYPDYAANPDRVEFAATKVAQRAAARGVDVNRYIFGASSTYMADVAKEMEKTFGKPAAGAEDEDDGTEDDRTAGLFGGNESGGRAAKADEQPKGGFAPHSMFGDVQEWQRKTGFTR